MSAARRRGARCLRNAYGGGKTTTPEFGVFSAKRRKFSKQLSVLSCHSGHVMIAKSLFYRAEVAGDAKPDMPASKLRRPALAVDVCNV